MALLDGRCTIEALRHSPDVMRSLKGVGIGPLDAEKVAMLDVVWRNLLRIYEPDPGRAWLLGVNPLIGTGGRSISSAPGGPRS